LRDRRFGCHDPCKRLPTFAKNRSSATLSTPLFIPTRTPDTTALSQCWPQPSAAHQHRPARTTSRCAPDCEPRQRLKHSLCPCDISTRHGLSHAEIISQPMPIYCGHSLVIPPDMLPVFVRVLSAVVSPRDRFNPAMDFGHATALSRQRPEERNPIPVYRRHRWHTQANLTLA